MLVRKPYANPSPRHPFESAFLFSGIRSVRTRQVLATGVGLNDIQNDSYDSEFFRWVDHLVPKP